MTSESPSLNRRFWLSAAIGLTLFGIFVLLPAPNLPRLLVVGLSLALVWWFTLRGIRAAARGVSYETNRRPGILFGFMLLFFVGFMLAVGFFLFQPMLSNPPSKLFYYYHLFILWNVVFSIGFNTDDDQLRRIGQDIQSSRWGGWLLTLLMLGILLYSIEFNLRFFAVRSFGSNGIPSTLNWIRAYWGENNSYGLRDREPVMPENDETIILVVGDSLMAGFGINNREDRITDRLDQRLGDGYDVYIVASSGWDTRKQIEELTRYPLTPDIVVVSYYINDIQGIYEEFYTLQDAAPPPYLKGIVEGYFLPGLLYWEFQRLFVAKNFLDEAFADEQLVQAHLADIQQLNETITAKGATAVYLLWPGGVYPEGSRVYFNKIIPTLDAEGIPYLDLTDMFLEYTVSERMVSAQDPHPSVLMNEIAEQHLYDLLLKQGLLEK